MPPKDWFFLGMLKLTADPLGRSCLEQAALMSSGSCVPNHPKGRCSATACDSG